MNDKKKALFSLGVILLVALIVVTLAPSRQSIEADTNPVFLEEQKDYFVDIDGDGDLDYVHFVQFIRQENEEEDPYPAPNQPGQ